MFFPCKILMRLFKEKDAEIFFLILSIFYVNAIEAIQKQDFLVL